MSEKKVYTRRQFVGGLGAGVATVAAVPMLAYGADAMPNAVKKIMQGGATAAPLEDPTKKYPKPPFEGQSQAWPGLPAK